MIPTITKMNSIEITAVNIFSFDFIVFRIFCDLFSGKKLV